MLIATIVKDLRLETSKSVATPGVAESEAEEVKEECEDWQEDGLYRAIAARINYLSLDRPDLQFASNQMPYEQDFDVKDLQIVVAG